MEYIAHIKDDDASDGVNRIEETVTEHSEKVAKLAEKYGQPLRIPHIVCIGAMLHDVGKLNKDFSEYIRGSSRYERGDCCLPRKTQKVGNHGISRNKAG